MRKIKGFTMIELIIVIAIIGILVAISVPAFQNLSQSARISAARGNLGAIRSTLAIKYAQSATGGANAAYPAALAAADFADGKAPSNPLLGGGAGIVSTSATVNTTVTSTAGFWFISSGASGGQAGAYTGTGTDLVDVSTF